MEDDAMASPQKSHASKPSPASISAELRALADGNSDPDLRKRLETIANKVDGLSSGIGGQTTGGTSQNPADVPRIGS